MAAQQRISGENDSALSPHTTRLDHFEKFLFYQQLDTLEEYLLVSQDYH